MLFWWLHVVSINEKYNETNIYYELYNAGTTMGTTTNFLDTDDEGIVDAYKV